MIAYKYVIKENDKYFSLSTAMPIDVAHAYNLPTNTPPFRLGVTYINTPLEIEGYNTYRGYWLCKRKLTEEELIRSPFFRKFVDRSKVVCLECQYSGMLEHPIMKPMHRLFLWVGEFTPIQEVACHEEE